jgi:hypothetical protein
MRRNSLRIETPRSSLIAREDAGAVTLEAVQVKRPHFFNERVLLTLSLADAARLYLWLGEFVGVGE